MADYSYIDGADAGYIESLFNDFKTNPDLVDPAWRKFFEGFEFALQNNGEDTVAVENLHKELKVVELIFAYRMHAHLISDTNPIRKRKNRDPELNLEKFDLDESDLETRFYAGSLLNLGSVSLKKILEFLNNTYCRQIGVEFMHIRRHEERNWLVNEFENIGREIKFSLEKKKRILSKLNEAVVFESFLHTKFIGQKRFSLEGGENTIPALDAIINKSSELGVEEVVIGMAHRGRLNVLANILGKTYEYIFSEFEGFEEPEKTMGDGDVKYHLGFSAEIESVKAKKVHIKLIPNPSHLEAVNPVVQGYTRGKVDTLYNEDNSKILPVLIHGDAALAGQGVMYEVAQMSQLPGYTSGGTIHFVINNQIGFTTDFDDARSSDYCTTLAREIDAPVLHVNGDNAEAVVYAVELACSFRQKFKRDVFIDLLCYRKHGHNEGDEPKFTQPNLYRLIANHPNPREVYTQQLIREGEIEAQIAKDMEKKFKSLLQDRLNMVKQKPLEYAYQPQDEQWRSLRKALDKDFDDSPETSVSKKMLDKVFKAITHVPENIKPLKTYERLIKDKTEKFNNGIYDWAMAELSAYGTLLLENNNIRMSGQDVIRGTFSHRHSEIYDAENNERYSILNNIDKKQAKFRIYNSLLSEFGVLGFEYGYSLSNPLTLTIWEAQFGDFVNGAQVVIDQFISSGASKWQKMTGLVMLLPHGYEGQGPEHSSARMERFLQLSAELNMVVANCSIPSNFFHILRRQLAWPFRKPLIIFTPKSLLRHPECVSSVDEFTKGKFKEIIDDENLKPKEVKRVVFCSGKIYYDLKEKQDKDKIKNVALIRLEQLYPLPKKQLNKIRKKYIKAEFYWVQEEPENMGAWSYLLRFEENRDLKLIARKASASPATGHSKVHAREQKYIVDMAMEL